MPKISIVIPVYNSEKYLKECFDSLIGQTFMDFEIIAVNDGSSDGSQTIIDNYAALYPNIVKSYSKENGGQGAARNYGLEKASGEYVLFMDSDDYIEKDMLEVLYNSAISNNSDLVLCDYNEIDVDSNKTTVRKAIRKFDDNIKTNYLLSNPSPWNKLIKLDVLKNNHIRFLEHHIYEDLATLPILAYYSNNICYVEKPFYDYIIHSNSTMRQKIYNKKLDSIFVAIAHLEKEFKSRDLYDKYADEIEFLYIQHLLYAASGRFLLYKEGVSKVGQIKGIMKDKFPNWRKNKYYKKQDRIFKISCRVFYMNNKAILHLYNCMRRVREV